MAMSSNPASQARSTGAEYIKLLLTTLGDRDPLSVQEETPERLRHAIAGLDETALRRAEQPGKWSILEVIQHLADSELVYGYRIRMIVSHPTPDIQGFDQDLWARELDYSTREPAEALREFESLRESNLRLLRSLGRAKMERVGNHNERGRESVVQMTRLYAGHDLLHLAQIDRIKKAIKV
jgi:hypothetical protein